MMDSFEYGMLGTSMGWLPFHHPIAIQLLELYFIFLDLPGLGVSVGARKRQRDLSLKDSSASPWVLFLITHSGPQAAGSEQH